jgi:hypothetical protein
VSKKYGTALTRWSGAHTLQRRPGCRFSAGSPPGDQCLIGHDVETVASSHALTGPACKVGVEDLGVEVRPEIHVAGETSSVLAVNPTIADLANDEGRAAHREINAATVALLDVHPPRSVMQDR